jgi:endonuclease III
MDRSAAVKRNKKRRVKPPAAGPRPKVVREICSRLSRAYGSPRLGNPRHPLDDLVFIIASNRTGATVASRVYASLRRRFRSWNELATVSPAELEAILAPAGLATKRAKHLIGIAKRLSEDFGRVTLAPLSGDSTPAIEQYLTSLPGVSEKVAKCVLLYGFGRRVLPVDVHVHRVASRLGWHTHKRADQSHATLEAVVAAPQRYGFHTNAIALGREICKAVPVCTACSLVEFCETGRKVRRTHRGGYRKGSTTP